jgi:hypothetical protein
MRGGEVPTYHLEDLIPYVLEELVIWDVVKGWNFWEAIPGKWHNFLALRERCSALLPNFVWQLRQPLEGGVGGTQFCGPQPITAGLRVLDWFYRASAGPHGLCAHRFCQRNLTASRTFSAELSTHVVILGPSTRTGSTLRRQRLNTRGRSMI